MQVRVITLIRKVQACRGCQSAPVSADKPVQFIEKSMVKPALLLEVGRCIG